MRLRDLVRVLATYIEPGDFEFRTCCVWTKGDGIATELRTNLLRVEETQSFINRDWVHPGLYNFLDVRADACAPSSHPFCAWQQRVGRTTTKSH